MNFTEVRARVPVLAFAAAVGLSGCGAPQAAAPPARSHTITVSQLLFEPRIISGQAGDTIVWVNRDFLRHSATDAGGAFDVDLLPGATGRIVLRQSGTIKFFCRYHPGMTGEVRVTAKR